MMVVTMLLVPYRQTCFHLYKSFSVLLFHRSKSTRVRRTRQNHKPNYPAVTSYDGLTKYRRDQASRSLLVSRSGHVAEVYRVLQRYGQVSALFPFTQNDKGYALVEMASAAAVTSIMETVRHFPNEDKIPIRTRSLYLVSSSRSSASVPALPSVAHREQLPVNQTELLQLLRKTKSVSEQMRRLHEASTMTELSTRLRFFLCSTLEETLTQTLPGCVVLPFGSSVNGFGRTDADLDLILEFDEIDQAASNGPLVPGLYYLSKRQHASNRLQGQLMLDTVGGILSHFMPYCVHVQRVLRARVPIVKFTHLGTGLQCDLSLSNRSALFMSELLHLYGQLDARVRPLVFTVRHWARMRGITHSNSGPWVSNFMLTWLVIYFLQVRPTPVLPSVRRLREHAEPGDKRIIDGEDMTFVRDWSRVPHSTNQEPLEKLLVEFFRFYSTLDLSSVCLSAVEACTLPRPPEDVSPLYLENPLERQLNAAKNVSQQQVTLFQEACACAVRLMEEERSRWGLVALLEEHDKMQRLDMKVAQLFTEDSSGSGLGEEGGTSAPITGFYTEPQETPQEGQEGGGETAPTTSS